MKISQLGAEYLILDDFIGMGGTLANLKSFIENAGAKIAGFQVLTGKPAYSQLYLRTKTLEDLRKKHGTFEKEFKKIVQFDYSGLTESEARYLLRAKTVERIRNQLSRSIRENYSRKDKQKINLNLIAVTLQRGYYKIESIQ